MPGPNLEEARRQIDGITFLSTHNAQRANRNGYSPEGKKSLYQIFILTLVGCFLCAGLLYIIVESWNQSISVTLDGVIWDQETKEILDTASIDVTGIIDGKVFRGDRFDGNVSLKGKSIDTYNLDLRELKGDVLNRRNTQNISSIYNTNGFPHIINLCISSDYSLVKLDCDLFPGNVFFIAPAKSVNDAEEKNQYFQNVFGK